MSKSYVLGYPRIGEKRELKKSLEAFWAGKCDFTEVERVARDLRKKHWLVQKDAGIDFISSNDFSYYDIMLDTIFMLGLAPKRFEGLRGEELYFSMARGNKDATAMEMTKWFNTNYHYIVPEISGDSKCKLDSSKVLGEFREAKELGIKTKINLIGPISFLALSKGVDGFDVFEKFDELVACYGELLDQIARLDDGIVVSFEEPIFAKDVDVRLLSLLKPSYDQFAKSGNKILVATYFEHSCEAVKVLVNTDIWALALDFVHGEKNQQILDDIAKSGKELFAGIIDGRNIWRADLDQKLELARSLKSKVSNLHLGSSCSLLHVPFSLKHEEKLDKDVKSWLSFAEEKLSEIAILKALLDGETLSKEQEKYYKQSCQAAQKRLNSILIHDENVKQRLKNLSKFQRDGEYEERIKIQKQTLKYPQLSTTTIGSFPQTIELRNLRRDYKRGDISKEHYDGQIKAYIDDCIKFQEQIGIDVLVHGEPERNDMVEYFGQMLKGYAFSQNGWVQSYGSRCVKPPLIYGDVSRPNPMTTEWISYAQSKTKKIVKGMLTGPVTILNWSFVRDDLPRNEVASQIALAICDEVNDLQNAGIKIIQVDEAAFKEGYPLREENVAAYEKWAVENFKLSVSSANKSTQIHTHMCYSEFNDIIKTIEAMDADVISIETARSGNELLRIFKRVGYKQEVGPGIYDIHSPRVPSVEEMVEQIKALLEVLPKEQLWINPDCGLKTRRWEEVKPSLENMVKAVKAVRNS
ncbi:MAG: 5-methyltetrahydropteroyltriglutamate--homocysteine S-methyltransferase [Proteobacteria bacterium]|nr:MAG: 5-methyltetrahydropteroyltriglutamate--homocysteine S-methyltransferase [Pseudomonadota bacterium]